MKQHWVCLVPAVKQCDGAKAAKLLASFIDKYTSPDSVQFIIFQAHLVVNKSEMLTAPLNMYKPKCSWHCLNCLLLQHPLVRLAWHNGAFAVSAPTVWNSISVLTMFADSEKEIV
jgi:hypothetical protein